MISKSSSSSESRQMEDEEESMLDMAFEVKKNSRLSCQIEFNDNLDGIKLTLAPE